MSKLSTAKRKELQKEALKWDEDIRQESSNEKEQLLYKAEQFKAVRPARQPISLRMDPFDISMIKRLARKKGLPPSQLMAMWLHERVEIEKEKTSSGEYHPG